MSHYYGTPADLGIARDVDAAKPRPRDMPPPHIDDANRALLMSADVMKHAAKDTQTAAKALAAAAAARKAIWRETMTAEYTSAARTQVSWIDVPPLVKEVQDRLGAAIRAESVARQQFDTTAKADAAFIRKLWDLNTAAADRASAAAQAHADAAAETDRTLYALRILGAAK
jgi:hypothetical protein